MTQEQVHRAVKVIEDKRVKWWSIDGECVELLWTMVKKDLSEEVNIMREKVTWNQEDWFFLFVLFCFLINLFIFIQLQLSAFSPLPSIPPQPVPPPSPTSTLPLDFVLVSFIVTPIDPSPHYPLPCGYCYNVLNFNVSGYILFAFFFCWLCSS